MESLVLVFSWDTKRSVAGLCGTNEFPQPSHSPVLNYLSCIERIIQNERGRPEHLDVRQSCVCVCCHSTCDRGIDSFIDTENCISSEGIKGHRVDFVAGSFESKELFNSSKPHQPFAVRMQELSNVKVLLILGDSDLVNEENISGLRLLVEEMRELRFIFLLTNRGGRLCQRLQTEENARKVSIFFWKKDWSIAHIANSPDHDFSLAFLQALANSDKDLFLESRENARAVFESAREKFVTGVSARAADPSVWEAHHLLESAPPLGELAHVRYLGVPELFPFMVNDLRNQSEILRSLQNGFLLSANQLEKTLDDFLSKEVSLRQSGEEEDFKLFMVYDIGSFFASIVLAQKFSLKLEGLSIDANRSEFVIGHFMLESHSLKPISFLKFKRKLNRLRSSDQVIQLINQFMARTRISWEMWYYEFQQFFNSRTRTKSLPVEKRHKKPRAVSPLKMRVGVVCCLTTCVLLTITFARNRV